MPVSKTHRIPLRVRNLITKAGTNNPEEIAAYLKIRVRVAAFTSSINSFCVTASNKKQICISDRLNEDKKNKAICWGIGYFVLGNRASEGEITYFENELYNQLLDSYLKIG